MFALHGSEKLFGWPGQKMAGLPQIAIAAGWIELVAGVLIAVGLFAGWVAFIASGQMAFAYFMGHASGGFFPTINKGELAVLYCFLFLYIATQGAGVWSVDGARKGRS